MKKTILFFLSLGLTLASWATPIDIETARSIAANFFKSSSQACATKRLHRPSAKNDMQLVYQPTMTTRTTHEAAEYYVFAPADSVGFVIVAGDDEVKPIVGYSFESSFSEDFMPSALDKFLTAYQLYIDDMQPDGTGALSLAFEQLKEKLEKGFAEYGFELIDYSASNPHHTDADSILVKTLLDVYESVTGTRAEAMAVGGGTYAHGIPGAVAFGPELQGIDNRIHGAEEFITVEHFKLNTKMMYKAVTELDKRLN